MMDDEDVVQRMRTLKLSGKRHQEQQSKDRKSKKKFELFPSSGKQTPLQPSNSIRLSSWSQTSRDLELRLSIPRSPPLSCFVFSEADLVVVKTPAGRHWSCPLHDKVEEQKMQAILMGETLLLKMNKRQQYNWPFYRLEREGTNPNSETDECTSLRASTSTGNAVKDDIDTSLGGTTGADRPNGGREDPCETTLSVLEVADGRVKLYLWLPGVSRESLRVEFRSWETIVTFVRSSQKASLDDEVTKTFVVGFSLEIIPHECHWSLLSEPVDVLELLVQKAQEGIWTEDTVCMKENNSKESDCQKHYPIPMETLPSETLTSLRVPPLATSSGKDASTQTAADSSTSTTNDTALSWVGVSAPLLRISSDLRAGGSPTTSSTSDEQDATLPTNGPAAGGRKEVQKPTCMVSPLSSPPLTKDPKEATHPQVRALPSLGQPGFVGLENLGNTCFINCVLQVLANIFELKEYFLSKRYIEDINAKNPLGMGGRLASSFAQVIEALWLGEEPSFSPTLLKNLIGQKQNRFMGYLQHDAEELMELLLDGLHEDLNRVKDKLYTAHPEDQPNLDPETAASSSWSRHKSRNDSFIVDLFQGQYHSKLACPKCGKVSITFDPFSVVQVPMPKKKKKIMVDVVVMTRRAEMKISRHRLLVEEESSVDQLLVELSRVDRNLKLSNLQALEVVGSRIRKTLYRTSKISNSGTLLLCEVDGIEDTGEPMVDVVVQQRTTLPLSSSTTRRCNTCRREDVRLRRCTRCFRVSYCNQKCQREDWSRHKAECKMEGDDVGCPFVVSLPARNTTYQRLVTALEAFASLSVHVVRPSHRAWESVPSSSLSSSKGAGDGPAVKSTLDNAGVDHSYTIVNGDRDVNVEKPQKQLDPTTQHNSSACHCPPFSIIPCSPPPLYAHDLRSSKALERPISDQGDKPLDLSSMRFVMLLWRNNYDSKLENQLVVSNKELDRDFQHQGTETREIPTTHLQDCFRLFTEPEVLSREQSWRCSQCKSECQATKELSLWRLPSYLIIHLKRFGFSEQFFFREKIEDLIQFPTRGLDISPYLRSREFSSAEDQATTSTSGQTPRNAWQQGHHSGPNHSPSPSLTTYDLFGVINHHGGMLGGHYTSYARCYGDERSEPIGWRLFDDSHVTPCQESDVVTSSAYVLFYKQRQTPNITSPGPSGFLEGSHQALPRRQNGQRVNPSAPSDLSSSSANQTTHPERSSITISLSYPFSSISTPSIHVSTSTSSLPPSPSQSHLTVGRSDPTGPPRDRSPEAKSTSVTSRAFNAAHISSPPSDQSKPHFPQSPLISPASGPTISAHCSLPSQQKPIVIAPCGSTGMETVWSVANCGKHPWSNSSDNSGNNGRVDENGEQ